MQKKAFNDSIVNDVLERNFLMQTIDLESDEGSLLAVKHRAYPAPQHLVFNADGQLIHRAKGMLSPHQLYDFLNTAADSLPRLGSLPKPFDFEMDYPDWYRNFRKSPAQRIVPKNEEVEAFLAMRDSITDEVTWAILYSLPTPETYIKQIVDQKEILSKRFGKDEVREKLSAYVYEDVKTAIKDHDPQKLNAALLKAENILGSDATLFQFRYRLYFHQYHREWDAYAYTALELSHHQEVATAEWLNDLAKTVLSETTNQTVLKTALRWMHPIVKKEKQHSYFMTTAMLEYAIGNIEHAEKLLKQALAAANDDEERQQTKALLNEIKGKGN